MTIPEAKTFLTPASPTHKGSQSWADLGCGSGIFTRALSSVLNPNAVVFAVDKLNTFDADKKHIGASIKFLPADFEKDELPFSNLGGLMMANSLHYVKDKSQFINKCKAYLTPRHQWIIIEYELVKANPWVPYPITFESLSQLFTNAGYTNIKKVNERPSVFNGSTMYCASINP